MIPCEILNVNKYVESEEEWESVYHHSLVSLPYHHCQVCLVTGRDTLPSTLQLALRKN